MDIVIKKRGNVNPQRKLPHATPYNDRFGGWGRVEAVHSESNSVDILFDTKLFLKNVPVSSNEWVMSGEDYISGSRDLPPVNARVFVLMPYGNYDGCFVLCSGFDVTDKPQQDEFLEEGKEKIRKCVTPANWKKESDYATGTSKIISPDGKTSIIIDYGDENETKENPEMHLTIFDQIKADVVDGDNASLSFFDDELKIGHKKGDETKIAAFGSVFTIKNGKIVIDSGGKIYIGGNADNLCGLLLALVDELIGFKSMGPPPQHVTHPDTIAKLNAYKEKIKALFMESA